jgi:DNA-binding transcriptional LysR family regulator
MQIQSFKVFADLIATGSFSKAAEANGITQSAVSQQVRAIEDRFQVRLLERGRRTVTLTPEGRAFLDASREILGVYDDLSSRIQTLRREIAGDLTIASILTIGLHELPPYLKVFRRTFPDVKVVMHYCRSDEVYARVIERRANIGLVAYPAPRRGLKAHTFWRDRLVLICSPTHPLAARRRITLDALAEETFIAFAADLPTRREIDRALRAARVKVRLAYEFDNIDTVKRAVEIENAISIVPETTARIESSSGSLRIVEIDAPKMFRPLGALVPSTAKPTPALTEFLAMLERTDLGGTGKPQNAE